MIFITTTGRYLMSKYPVFSKDVGPLIKNHIDKELTKPLHGVDLNDKTTQPLTNCNFFKTVDIPKKELKGDQKLTGIKSDI